MSGAIDLARGLGGKIEKEEIRSAVDQYEKYHGHFGGDEGARKANYTDMVNKYYDLSTSFYEFGWGESFHFAHRWKEESLRESIKRHEHFLALQLGLKPGMKVLDVGCGIGGPLREIARFSSTSVTGLNNNDYQISRGKVIWEADLASESPVPWYLPLDTSHFSLSSFRLTSVGRFITKNLVRTLEFIGIAPEGSQRVSSFLEKAADGLVEGGR
ncbi:Cycloartenol-C-24-methyltransferase 1 [Acorus calamus]|uniref:Cycloartenol-C-24-methyltransferase 1 n=1 Tax=Acorus calamus TaxID=4465 RepID=A0AAV9E012_ACOCL|nr:Cycloartenol-C-24-methyltransferase 1 [Acorus calamus]